MDKEFMLDLLKKDDTAYKNKIEMVTSSIKKAILSGALKSGEKISSEELCKLFNVSRAPVREGLRRLESEGLLTIVPQQYIQISEINPVTYIELGQLRTCLELAAFDLFLGRFTPDVLDTLHDIVKSEGQEHVANAGLQLALDFHYKMIECAGNHELFLCYDRVMSKFLCYMNIQYRSETGLYPYHTMIVHALRQNDTTLARNILIKDLDACNSFNHTCLKNMVSSKNDFESTGEN